MKENGKILTGMLIGALLASVTVFLYLQNLHAKRFENQQILIIQQAQLTDSIRNSGLPGLLGNVLNKIDAELKDNPQRKLSDETIARIAALCYIAKPYLIPEGDSLSTTKVSPERGQLLLFISGMKLDSGSMKKIKETATFSGSDLRDADLSGIDLSWINLKGANLKGANLQNANLTASNLSFANLWGANLNKAKLTGADLKRAELSWAELNHAQMKNVNLTGANLISTQLRNTDLHAAVIRWVDATGVFLNEADLTKSDLHGTILRRGYLVKANFSEANMTMVNLSAAELNEANLTGTTLTRAIVSELNWLSFLDERHINGASEIQSKYIIKDESSNGQINFALEPIKMD